MERIRGAWHRATSSFGAIPAVALGLGLVLGLLLPFVDSSLEIDFPIIEFADADAARSLLSTIATVTVSVAGLAFSVTLVALTLASSQLSPRVLRTFETDRLSQATLGLFLGTFIYCIAVLLRLDEQGGGGEPPNLALTVAALLALVAFFLFALFLHHIVRSLQPSTVISRIAAEAVSAAEGRYPHEVGSAPEDADAATRLVREREQTLPGREIVATGAGYLGQIRGADLARVARRCDGLVIQRTQVGEYVVPGDVLAVIHAAAGEIENQEDGTRDPVSAARDCFVLVQERSLRQDPGFPIRQLADIALKGVSPGINDPTTTQNAMEALTAALIRFARTDAPARIRVDVDGEPRLVASTPELDDLIRLAFEQPRVFAAPYPVLAVRLLELLERIEREAREAGIPVGEPARQALLLREGPEGEVPTSADVEAVAAAYERLHGGADR